MTSLLAVALVVPVAVALLLALAAARSSTSAWTRRSPRAAAVVPVVGTVVAGWWAVLAMATEAPEWGRLAVTPVVAVAVSGVAVLVAASDPTRILGRSVALSAVTVFAIGATASDVSEADGALAAGVAALAVLVAIGQRAEGVGWVPVSVTVAGGLAVAAGVLQGDADLGAVVAIAGLTAVLVAAPSTTGPFTTGAGSGDGSPIGAAMLPAAMLAIVRILDAAPPATGIDRIGIDRIGIAGAALGAVAALTQLKGPARAAPARLPLAIIGAGIVVAVQDLPDASGAGLLLVAGGVLALAARHPVGAVAGLPGLTAALVVFGSATEPVHAAAGAVAVGLLVAGAAGAPSLGAIPTDGLRRVLVLAALAFAVLPVWGWSAITLTDHSVAVATAAAFALPAGVLLTGLTTGLTSGLPTGRLPRGTPRPAGRLTRRRDLAATPTHGSTILEVDGEIPRQEARREARVAEEGSREQDGPAQRPVAVPPGAVHVRTRPGGAPVRGRLRARPRRTP